METKMMLKFIFSLLIILAVCSDMSAFIYVNDIVCAFSITPEKEQIEVNVINGTKNFITAQSSINLLLLEYEKSGLGTINLPLSINYAETAINELESAIIYYSEAYSIGAKIGYNEEKRDRFRLYDYETYITTNKMNRSIADKVKVYLSNFDVIGLYKQNIDNLKDINSTVYDIRDTLKSNITPTINIYWKLAQQVAEASLFANYSTVLGTSILEKCQK